MGRKMRFVLGIDPGAKGGLVLLDETGKIRRMHRMPKVGDSSILDISSLIEIFDKYGKFPLYIYMEEFNTNFFGMGKKAIASLMRQRGTLEGLISGIQLKYPHVKYALELPRPWQSEMFKGIRPIYKPKKKDKKTRKLDTKAMALVACQRIFPGVSFIPKGCKTPQDGLLDAALIAEYGRRIVYAK